MIQLYPFQEEAVRWLSERKAALLALDMGLGKTGIAIRAADSVQAMKVLVLCPAAAVVNWHREFDRFSALKRPQLRVLSYGLVPKLGTESAQEEWDLVILDESHYLKSTDALRTVVVWGKNGLLRRVKRVWCLSGTPAPNNASELWPMLFSFGRTKLSYSDFVTRYCKVVKYGGRHANRVSIQGTKTAMVPELRQILEPIMLRKKQDEVIDLPPIHFSEIVVPPGPVDLGIDSSFIQYVFPHDQREDFLNQLQRERDLLYEIVERAKPLEKAAALASVANSVQTLRRYTGLQKVEAVAELVASELRSGAYEKIVIFAIHQGVIELLRQKLRKFHPVTLYGATPPHKRQMNVDKFQLYKKYKVFIGNIHAAGTAITLTAANQVMFVELDFVPGNNNQAAMRCRRIGQKRPVFVRFTSVANSIDERITAILRRKSVEIAALIDGECLPRDAPLASLKAEFDALS